MKPSNKTEMKQNNMAPPKIQNYFKSTPKTFVVEDHNNNGCSSSQTIYVEALKNKLRSAQSMVVGDSNSKEDHLSGQPDDGARASVCVKAGHDGDSHSKSSNECSRAECVQKVIACQEWEKKYKELKKVYVKLTIYSTERDMKYEDLLKVATNTHHPGTDEMILSSDGIFTPNEVKALENMASDKPKDSTFILECLQWAYKTDLSVLCRKTLKGTAEWIEITNEGEKKYHSGKDPLTPEKVDRIKKMFIDRVSKCNIDSVAYGQRIKEAYINKLFASGIKNIAKKQSGKM